MAQTRGSGFLKRIDRIAGVALLTPFALQPKRRPPPPHSVRRIGLLKSAAIGDTLLLAGLLDDTRRAYPGASVIMITGPDNRAAADLLPARADEHIVVSPTAPIAAVRAIRRARLDVIVDFGAWPRFDALLATLSGARFRLGFRTPGQFRHTGFDRSVAHSNLIHERENYVALLAELGVDSRVPPRIAAPDTLKSHPPAPYVVFHAWSSGYMHQVKEWPADRWAALGVWATARGWTVVLSGSAREAAKTRALGDRLRSAGATVVNAAGRHTLSDMADLVAHAEVVVSVNTGLMHLAALAGARTVSLEGPTPPARWGPLGPHTRSVVSTYSDSGYLDLGFEYAGHRLDCMDGISVDAVTDAIDELLAVPTATQSRRSPPATPESTSPPSRSAPSSARPTDPSAVP